MTVFYLREEKCNRQYDSMERLSFYILNIVGHNYFIYALFMHRTVLSTTTFQ